MRSLLYLLPLLLLISTASAQNAEDVEKVLDDFHLAASEADSARYFGHFAEGAIFFGTDLTERWTLAEFQAYAAPHFGAGRGWTYIPQTRAVFFNGDTAWFDEELLNERFGMTRGTGVLLLQDGEWKIAQYHLTLPVPNDLIYDLVDRINASGQ